MPLRPLRARLPLLPAIAMSAAMVSASVVATGPLPGVAGGQAHPVKTSRQVLDLEPVSLDALARGESGAEATATGSPSTAPSAAPDGRSRALARARSGAMTRPQPVPRSLAVVGVVWDPGAVDEDDVIEIRVRKKGSWGPWQEMERDADHGPDTTGPGGAEGLAARPGTAPHVVSGEQTQVRLLSTDTTAPAGVEVTLVDPGTSEADATAGAQAAGSASAGAARPTILTRRDWGADESLRDGTPGYGQAHIAFVHHTVDANSYTSAQVPAIIRGIYDYHVKGQGWSDIGYNFLVDRFGRTWEGRYGGVDKAVIGAQTMNYNSWSFGVAAIGTYTSATPPSGMVGAIQRLIAWKFTLHGNPATGRVYARDRYFERISGHRDGFQTSCPGQRLYDLLPSMRRNVTSLMGTMSTSRLARSVDGGGTPDLLSYPGTLAPASLAGAPATLRGASPQPVREARTIGSGWNALGSITLTPDLTGDGRADIVARDPQRNALRVYSGDGRGGFAGVAIRGAGWNVMTRLVAAGDRTGDGRNDLLAVRQDGALALYPGDGRGWVANGTVIATGLNAMSSLATVGDVTGDGLPDLMAIRSSDGALLVYPGASGGGVAAPVRWGGGWGALNSLLSGPDVDGDGLAGDVLVREQGGRMRTYYADANGKPARYNFWGRGWNVLDSLSSGADWNGDGTADLIARYPKDSTLRLYPGNGQRDFAAPALQAPADVTGVDLMRVVGDIDRDGYADAVARTESGDLYAMRGTPGGGFTRQSTLIGRGWQVFDLVEAAGDFSNDGTPDVMARTTGGQLRLYTFDRDLTLGWWIELGTGWQVIRSVAGAGSLNADYNADIVALRESDGALLIYRGSGPGTLNDAVVAVAGQGDLSRLIGVGDHNGDGRNDVLAEDVEGRYWLYVGDGNGLSKYRQPVRVATSGDDVLG